MSEFNPDEYLAEKPASDSFDPDAYLGEAPKPADAPAAEPESFGHSLVRGALEAAPVAGALGGGVLGATAGGVPAIGGAGLGYAAGKQVEKLGKHYLLGEEQAPQTPVQQAGEVAGDVAMGATAELGGPIIGKVASKIPNFAQRLATSPLPEKIAKAANVTGHAKNIFGSVAKAAKIFDDMPGGAQKVADVISDVGGRVGAYHSPLAPIQAISDTAKVVSKAQSGAAYLLDKAPQKLGRFAPLLQNAAKRGATALATTDFFLQKTDPEYQKIMKEAREQ